MNRETEHNRQKTEHQGTGRFYETVVAVALFLTLLFGLAVLLPIAFIIASPEDKEVDTDNIFRMHIIANSDSERDQQIKLAVRDALLEFEAEATEAAKAQSSAEAERILAENGSGILETARSVLRRYGAEYDAQLLIGTFDFPERQYGETIYPAGEYRALRILLGDAGGKNWWCVMFPPLCIVDANSEKIENEAPIRFDSLFVRLWKYIFGGKSE
ncbi:MAG: stage II sporulation protein R [Christensenellaceae bacterium]|nr:stage II sporulation protein R [Christensenellaceae bacterium]